MLNRYKTARRSTATALAVTAFSASAAVAQEFCIVCTAPAGMYRCAIDNYKPGAAPDLGAVCTSAMSRVGAHSACTVGKGITVLDCNGPLMRVDIANATKPVVTNSAVEDAKAAKAKSEKGEPKTVLEMIKRAQSPAASDSDAPQPAAPAKQPDQKSAKTAAPAPAPPTAAKSNPLADTWRCMSSLFTKCGD